MQLGIVWKTMVRIEGALGFHRNGHLDLCLVHKTGVNPLGLGVTMSGRVTTYLLAVRTCGSNAAVITACKMMIGQSRKP